MPNVIIEVRTTCPTCGGSGFIRREGEDTEPCSPCRMTGTVVDAERSQWLRMVAEWAVDAFNFAEYDDRKGHIYCGACRGIEHDHAPDCPHVLAKKTMSVVQ